MQSTSTGDFRLSELLAALSMATDLADGHPLEKSLRTCYIAVELGKQLGLSPAELAEVHFASLLRLIGCTSFAHEESRKFGGDDITLRNLYAGVDFNRLTEVLPPTLTSLAKKESSLRRARTVLTFLTSSRSFYPKLVQTHCEVGQRLAQRLGMKRGVVEALDHMHERWDGRGKPNELSGNAIHRTARIVQFAHVIELHLHQDGVAAACRVAKGRAGGQFDPEVVKAFIEIARDLLSVLEEPSIWDHVLDNEPGERRMMNAKGIDRVAQAFADFVDLKSIYTLGHSRSVAMITEAVSAAMDLGQTETNELRWAALLHDLGRVSVPTGIWEKKGKLSVAEWERIHLHAYYSERILMRSPILENVARIAGMHHERLDGSGYHRNHAGGQIPRLARILEVADVHQALRAPRPHRQALSDAEAAKVLSEEASSGRLDAGIVQEVLARCGHYNVKFGITWPAGLSDREVQVLRQLARGLTNKEIAARLFVSPKTIQHHVAHIYNKIGVSTRAGAALFAVENDLLGTDPK